MRANPPVREWTAASATAYLHASHAVTIEPQDDSGVKARRGIDIRAFPAPNEDMIA